MLGCGLPVDHGANALGHKKSIARHCCQATLVSEKLGARLLGTEREALETKHGEFLVN